MTIRLPRCKRFFRRFLSICTLLTFILNSLLFPTAGYTQTVLNLPTPGTMLQPTPGFIPTIMRGVTIHPDNLLQFDFIVDTGNTDLKGEQLQTEGTKLIKYFLAALTIPEKDLWVNLSPYEKNRIIPESFGLTEMGRDLLAQDYLLKQLTASMMYPEGEMGKKFWDRVYAQAKARYGQTEIPLNTFNKIWIVPDKAVIYEQSTDPAKKDLSAFVVNAHFKVMLEEDYLAKSKISPPDKGDLGGSRIAKPLLTSPCQGRDCSIPTEILREILIPEIEKEVNEGKTFANLRQIFHSMLLATWHKENLKQSLLGQVYADKNKTRGIDLEDKEVKLKIYNQYLEAFKKGVYDYIKDEYDPQT